MEEITQDYTMEVTPELSLLLIALLSFNAKRSNPLLSTGWDPVISGAMGSL